MSITNIQENTGVLQSYSHKVSNLSVGGANFSPAASLVDIWETQLPQNSVYQGK